LINEITDSRDLIFSFNEPFIPRQFDDDNTHGMHHRMKRVDFIVHSPMQTWLVEVKDPENRGIPPGRQAVERASFRKKIRSGTLFTRELAPKFTDTLVYLTLSHRAPINEIRYIVFIGLTKLDARALETMTKRLKSQCYCPGPFGQEWASRFSVIVVNQAAWNRNFAPHSVRRKP
jgi:hypothetical protein